MRKFGITLIVVAFVCWFLFLSTLKTATTRTSLMLIVSGNVAFLTLWLWMVSDYMRNKDQLHLKPLWGWFLLLANWFAGVVYFIVIYSKREIRENRGR